MNRVTASAAPRAAQGPPGRRARRQAETRARILHAALDLFARQGFFSTTVEQITEAADVGKGTFFNYFPSKEHVLAGFGEVQIAKVQAAREEARHGVTSMRQIWHDLLRELAREPARSPALLRGLIVVNLSSEEVGRVADQNMARGRQELAHLIAETQERGEMRPELKPAQVARLFQQTFLGTMLLSVLDPSVQLNSWLDITFDFLWSSVANQGQMKLRRRPAQRQGRSSR
jgi:AcrR family transcriptional regulator